MMGKVYASGLLLLLFFNAGTARVGTTARAGGRAAVQVQCSPFDGHGVQHCATGIPSGLLRVVVRQHDTEWCWAACISSVFSYYGHPISQERIVQETFGSILNLPGRPEQIYQALNRNWVDDNGLNFTVTADVLTANYSTAIHDLAAGYPLIVGALGHAMVLSAVEYNHDVYDRVQITSATVRDPWPLNASPRVLTPQEWYNVTFLTRIRVY